MQAECEKGLAASAEMYETIRKTASVGMRELELYAAIGRKLGTLGYTENQYKFDFLSGPRTAQIDGGPTDREIETGDLLLVDFSLEHAGVWCDTCRMFFFGEPTEEQKAAYAILVFAMEAGFRALASHAGGDTVYRAVTQPMQGRMPHHAGHGIGEKPFQSPIFNGENGASPQAGDIVTLEPGLYVPPRWGMRIENDFRITGSGAERLFNYPLEMAYFIL